MERLTKQLDDVCVYIGPGCKYKNTGDISTEVEPWNVRKVLKRLATYEDTGLDPEEIRELATAKKDGRLVVLPCKVGDTVYFVFLGRIIEKTVFSLVTTASSQIIYCAGTSQFFRPEDVGKTVFLTREEAEAALKGGGDNEQI